MENYLSADPSGKTFKNLKAWRISVFECIREAGRACLYPDFQQLCPDRHKTRGSKVFRISLQSRVIRIAKEISPHGRLYHE